MGINDGWIFHIIGRQIGQQPFDAIDGILIAVTGKVSHTAFFIVRFGAAQIFKGNLFPGNGFNDFGPGNEHIAAAFDHKHPVGHRR